MDNLVIINEADISSALQVASTLSSYCTYVFDPKLVDIATARGLKNIEFLPLRAAPIYLDVETNARVMAKELGEKLDLTLRKFRPDISISTWQYLNFYYFFQSYLWYNRLWSEMQGDFKKNKIFVFMCENPCQYYEPSYFPALLLLQLLLTKGIEFKAFSYPLESTHSNNILSIPANAVTDTRFDLLTHIPTCFYDYPYFNSEIQSLGISVVNILGPKWNVPVVANKHIGVTSADVAALAMNTDASCDPELLCALEDSLSLELMPYIASSFYRNLQATYIAKRYAAQIVNFDLLANHFKYSPPKKVLITDHDAGLHGPLFQFAEYFDIPVVVVPHSKTFYIVTSAHSNVIALRHAIQGGPIFRVDGSAVSSFGMAYPDKYVASNIYPSRIKRVGVILNDLSLNGICSTNYLDFIESLRNIHNWCSNNNVILSIRGRPDNSIFGLISRDLEIDPAQLRNNMEISLKEYAKDIDFCILHGVPSSAALEFLNNSIPVISVLIRPLSLSDLTVLSAEMVPQFTSYEATKLLDAFNLDSRLLFDFRNNQIRNYLDRSLHTQPLRGYLQS